MKTYEQNNVKQYHFGRLRGGEGGGIFLVGVLCAGRGMAQDR